MAWCVGSPHDVQSLRARSPKLLKQVSSSFVLIPCIEIADFYLAGSSDRVCFAAIGDRRDRTWVLMTSVEDGVTSV